MIQLVSDHIITPLGIGVDANIQAILEGKSMLKWHDKVHGQTLVEPLIASFFDKIEIRKNYSPFESLCIECAEVAIRKSNIKVDSDKCIFILSTTKGNIWNSLWESASKVARYFDNQVSPIVVSTACTSGVSAQVVAYRLLNAHQYDSAIVIGCDVQSEFVVSGFQSFKALSKKTCKPYDANRDGLNIGEAVATMVLTNKNTTSGTWNLLGGSVHNDANHISGPSRTGEGSLRCLQDMQTIVDSKDWACLSVHGTGTLYNDEMESIAIHRAGCDDVPVSALKGYYGHAMGAAGLLETILTLHSVEQGILLPTKGYETQGTSYAVNISHEKRTTDKNSVVKLLSGFGGVNAAVLWSKKNVNTSMNNSKISIESELTLENEDVVSLYRTKIGNYPKFFKMDKLSKVGFVASELLKKQLPENSFDSEKTAVIFASKSGSLVNDIAYQATIENKENYFPSPAIFVYTLPNIVTGEVAIYHKLFGESLCCILPDEEALDNLVEVILPQSNMASAIVGWVECPDKDNFVARVKFVKLINR